MSVIHTNMCLLCCGGCAYAGYKTNKAMDKAFSANEEPVESYWKTELKHSLNIRSSRVQEERDYDRYGSSRKMTKKEQESRERLQKLVEAHAPSKKTKQ